MLSDAAARLVCVDCAASVEPIHRQLAEGSKDSFALLSATIAGALATEPSMEARIMGAARLLWTRPRPRTGRRLPFVVDVLPGLRRLPLVDAGVDPTEPLATAPLGWRMVTLLGIAKLLNLDDQLASMDRPQFTIAQMMEWTEDWKPRRQADERRVLSTANSPQSRPPRSDAEYLALARSIIGSEKWREAQGRDSRTRQKVLSALIDTVLTPSAGAPP